MELTKLAIDEMRNFDDARMREVERDLRKELFSIKMDIFTAPAQHTGKIRNLKVNLARLLTVKNEKKRRAQMTETKTK